MAFLDKLKGATKAIAAIVAVPAVAAVASDAAQKAIAHYVQLHPAWSIIGVVAAVIAALFHQPQATLPAAPQNPASK